MKYLWLPLAGALAVLTGAGLARQQQSATPAAVPASVQAGALAAMPETCTRGALYVALDQPPGEQLQICQNEGFLPALSLGPSGALAMDAATLDIVPAVVPLKQSMNDWGALNTFSQFRLVASTGGACVDPAADLGRVRVDTSDAANTRLAVCGYQAGKLQWLAAYLSPAGANSWGTTTQ